MPSQGQQKSNTTHQNLNAFRSPTNTQEECSRRRVRKGKRGTGVRTVDLETGPNCAGQFLGARSSGWISDTTTIPTHKPKEVCGRERQRQTQICGSDVWGRGTRVLVSNAKVDEKVVDQHWFLPTRIGFPHEWNWLQCISLTSMGVEHNPLARGSPVSNHSLAVGYWRRLRFFFLFSTREPRCLRQVEFWCTLAVAV